MPLVPASEMDIDWAAATLAMQELMPPPPPCKTPKDIIANGNEEPDDGFTILEVEEAVEAAKEQAKTDYKGMISDTRDLPLQKLVLSAAGCRVFEDLCALVDVNQAYADLLPQWKDLAHKLSLDELKTEWVSVCVRPQEGLTR